MVGAQMLAEFAKGHRRATLCAGLPEKPLHTLKYSTKFWVIVPFCKILLHEKVKFLFPYNPDGTEAGNAAITDNFLVGFVCILFLQT